MLASWMWCRAVISETTLGLCGYVSPNPCQGGEECDDALEIRVWFVRRRASNVVAMFTAELRPTGCCTRYGFAALRSALSPAPCRGYWSPTQRNITAAVIKKGRVKCLPATCAIRISRRIRRTQSPVSRETRQTNRGTITSQRQQKTSSAACSQLTHKRKQMTPSYPFLTRSTSTSSPVSLRRTLRMVFCCDTRDASTQTFLGSSIHNSSPARGENHDVGWSHASS